MFTKYMNIQVLRWGLGLGSWKSGDYSCPIFKGGTTLLPDSTPTPDLFLDLWLLCISRIVYYLVSVLILPIVNTSQLVPTQATPFSSGRYHQPITTAILHLFFHLQISFSILQDKSGFLKCTSDHITLIPEAFNQFPRIAVGNVQAPFPPPPHCHRQHHDHQ